MMKAERRSPRSSRRSRRASDSAGLVVEHAHGFSGDTTLDPVLRYDISSYRRWIMGRTKVGITLEADSLLAIDRLVVDRRFPNRSQAIQEAVDEKLARLSHTRLARECAKLDPDFEQSLAEEGVAGELAEWPEY
jgi:Arc/MetJ-type ribon-helix-helix transcriptional regulator